MLAATRFLSQIDVSGVGLVPGVPTLLAPSRPSGPPRAVSHYLVRELASWHLAMSKAWEEAVSKELHAFLSPYTEKDLGEWLDKIGANWNPQPPKNPSDAR